MSEYLDCVEVGPREDAKSSVIWLHGLGANGHDFEPIVPLLEMNNTRFVFPHAPVMPVTINMGMTMPAWYDILTMDESPDREPPGHIRASAEKIEALLQREKQRGIAAENIVLAGFSQGGAMALHTGLRHQETLAGIMVLSAYLVLPSELASAVSDANSATAMLFCHGTHDPMVPCRRGKAGMEAVTALNPQRPVIWEEFPMGHEVCPPELGVIKAWLHARLVK
ncbi:MAG: carboxylesterase [Myxococcales bacterium]|nr:carboxylesterase [Myxococcales bacterium]|tara:strand:+ start:67 stop:738 length:672 start_codon:yes stop_codon:yes gene_type:complete